MDLANIKNTLSYPTFIFDHKVQFFNFFTIERGRLLFRLTHC